LYCALNVLRSDEKNIQTVEDPVEYQLEAVNQMQVKPAIGLDFADALRSILRQDPDVIMVGEIRDTGTARIAMRASLTGHLVLSTLHTNDAPSAFIRLRDIGLEPYLVAATLRMVVSQRLVRVICGECKEEARPSEELLRLAVEAWPDAGSWRYCRGAGCKHCNQTGYRGRTAIFEILEATPEIRQLTLNCDDEVEFTRRAIESGMEPLHVNGLRKVKRGITTIEEVLRVSPLGELC
jgi:type II secretory ATPase GspE/PulE/Tfp pilus assembly ATPase PilB-like protein